MDVEYGVEALQEAANRLYELDHARFLKVLALCWAYLALFEHPPGSPADVLEWCSAIVQARAGAFPLA